MDNNLDSDSESEEVDIENIENNYTSASLIYNIINSNENNNINYNNNETYQYDDINNDANDDVNNYINGNIVTNNSNETDLDQLNHMYNSLVRNNVINRILNPYNMSNRYYNLYSFTYSLPNYYSFYPDQNINDEPEKLSIKDLNKNSKICIIPEEKKMETCNICLENFENNNIARELHCKHYFHQECIDKWLEDKLECPLCRQNLKNTETI